INMCSKHNMSRTQHNLNERNTTMQKLHALVLTVVFAAVCFLGACTGITPRPLPQGALDQLNAMQHQPASAGNQIYEERVVELDGRVDPLFTYERRVRKEDGAVTSTHVTHDLTGSVVVVQSASHSLTYELHRADLVHGQSGISASVVIVGDEAIYTLHDGVR